MLPRCLVFDLDGCVWDPEMYELWGGGGAPFKQNKDGTLTDRGGTKVALLGDVKNLMHEFATESMWKQTKICVASSCDEPDWARECISKFDIGAGLKLSDVFDKNNIEIYKRSKDHHLREIANKTGVALEEMMFFDNQTNNCQTVSRIGVTVVYTPDGVTRQAFQEGLDKYPAPGEIIGPKSRGHY
jgi:magnesium-dependent phosphatase 1